MSQSRQEYQKEYYKKNKERILEQSKLYHKKNKEKYKKYLADYYIKHKEKLKGDARRTYYAKPFVLKWAQRTIYNHRADGNKINISPPQLVEIAMKHKTCQFCGVDLIFYNGNEGKGKKRKDSVSLDRKNNENLIDEDSILILCAECNRLKGSKTLKEFYDYCQMIVNSEFFKYEKF